MGSVCRTGNERRDWSHSDPSIGMAYSLPLLGDGMVTTMNEFAVVLLCLGLLFVLYRFLSHRRDASAELFEAPQPFHAVAIKPGKQACAEAIAMKGRRFLSSEAPRLPLAGCRNGACTCVYQHYQDRRSRVERRDPYGLRTASWEQPDQQERRARRGRRYTDRVGHGLT